MLRVYATKRVRLMSPNPRVGHEVSGMTSKFTATGSSAIVLQSVFMTGPSVDPVTLTDRRARSRFTQVTFLPLHAEQTRLDLVQVVTSRAELRLQEADVRLVTAFLQSAFFKNQYGKC